MRVGELKRSGTTIVESAVVFPIVIIGAAALVIGAVGIFRYQEVAALARRAARYASVHGTQYAKDTGNTAATATDIYDNAIKPNLVALDTNQLGYSVSYTTSNQPAVNTIVNNYPIATQNYVSVTVTYTWVNSLVFGTINLSSTSVMPMSY